MKMADWVGQTLRWVQPRALKQEFELRAQEIPIATLRFRSAFRSEATAESAEGCWTFWQVGFWRQRILVRECGAETDLAVFHRHIWRGGGIDECTNVSKPGSKFPLGGVPAGGNIPFGDDPARPGR